MIKKSLSILLICSMVAWGNNFPSYVYDIQTNIYNGQINITFDISEFQLLAEELSDLRIIKTNCLRYVEIDEKKTISDKKIDTYKKKDSRKKIIRSVVIGATMAIITGFVAGWRVRSQL